MNKSSSGHKFAYVLTCVDPANINTLVKIFNLRFGKGGFFMPGELGGVKGLVSPEKKTDREFIFRKIKTANLVHKIDILVLVNHSGCGAYRLAGHTFEDRSAEKAFHAGQMEKAAKLLKKKLTGVEIEAHYFLKEEQKMAW